MVGTDKGLPLKKMGFREKASSSFLLTIAAAFFGVNSNTMITLKKTCWAIIISHHGEYRDRQYQPGKDRYHNREKSGTQLVSNKGRDCFIFIHFPPTSRLPAQLFSGG